MNTKLRIGLDFDGVISDCGKLKEYAAWMMFSKRIPACMFKKEILTSKGLLTPEQYRTLQQEIYGTEAFGLRMEQVPGMMEYTQRLRDEGYQLQIVTARGDKETHIARKWMRQQGIHLPIVGTRGESKASFCKGLDVYVDDDLDKLEPLVGIVPQRYLFSWGYNQDMLFPPELAERVHSWKEVYERVTRNSHIPPQ